MSDLASVPAPVLVYNRIDRNRHKTWMLIAFSAAAVLPFILGISLLMSAGVVWRVRSQTRQTRSMIRFDQGVLQRLNDGPRTEWTQQFELDLKGDQQNWTLVLTPHDAHVRQHILGITVSGSAAGPRCLTTNAPNDAATVMLVAEAAQSPPPKSADRAAFEALCRGAAAP